MSGKHTYAPHDDGQVLQVYYRRAPDAQEHIRRTYRCVPAGGVQLDRQGGGDAQLLRRNSTW